MPAANQHDLIGRDAEIEAALASLSTGGLTLLLGPGGAGKTTIARAVAARPEVDGALFCDLSRSSSADDVVAALGNLLGLTFESRESSVSQLRHALGAHGDRVIIVDNLEGLTGGAEVLLELIGSGPRFLGTSRIVGPFGAARVLELGPLPHADALRLFIDRARRVLPTFTPDDATRTLVDRLHGSPLAIELAAARARVLSPAQLLERFGQHLDLLRGGEERPEKHRTLRAVVEGSWSLCSEEERRALEAASLFHVGFDLAATESLIGSAAVDLLERLLQSSLVSVADTGPLGARFRLSESVRDFAAERLAETPSRGAELERRYAEHYRELARRWSAAAENGDRTALAVLTLDAENVLAGYRLDGRAALAFDIVFQRTTPVDAHIAALSAARARLMGAPLEDRAELEVAIAQAQRRTGNADATRAQSEAAADLARAAGRDDLVARATLVEAAAAYDAGRLSEASALGERAVALSNACGMPAIAARASSLLAFSAMESGDLRAADRHGERAMTIAREHGLTLVEFNAENLFGAVEARRSRLANAEDHLRRGLLLIEGLGLAQQEALAWGNLGKVLLLSGRHEVAREALSRALELSRRSGLRRVEALQLVNIGKLEADLGRLAEARARALEADALVRRIGSHLPTPITTLMTIVALLEGRFEDAADALERVLSQGPPIEREAARASLHGAYAAALALGGRVAEAERALTRARDVVCEDTAFEVGMIAAHTATVHFARAEIAHKAGNAAAARAAYREGLATIALSEAKAATSVDVRLARRSALAKADALPPVLRAAEEHTTPSAKGSFEVVSRAGTTTALALPADADLAFDAVERRVVIDGRRALDLRKKPLAARLLEVVLGEPGKRHEKADLFRDVWQTDFRTASQSATLYKAVDRLAHLLDPDPRRFLRWDETGALVLVARQPALLRAPPEATRDAR